MVRNGDKEGIAAFDKSLWAPPAGVAKEVIAAQPQWTAAEMENTFMAQLARSGTRG